MSSLKKISNVFPALNITDSSSSLLLEGTQVDLGLLNSKLTIESSKYIVKVATSMKELKEVFRLRYEVFHLEYASKKVAFGADRDIYDERAFHFIVKSKELDQVVGYYRFILAEKVEDFYSHSEYDLQPLMSLEGKVLELSRACIHQDFRNGNVLALIWRGLTRFSKINNVRYWFGIPSIKTDCVEDVSGLYEFFKRNHYLHSEISLDPRDGFRLPSWEAQCKKSEGRHDSDLLKIFEQTVPALLKLYMRAGTKFIGKPAYDSKFKCYDFCTLIDVHHMNSRYQKKYSTEGSESANRLFNLPDEEGQS